MVPKLKYHKQILIGVALLLLFSVGVEAYKRLPGGFLGANLADLKKSADCESCFKLMVNVEPDNGHYRIIRRMPDETDMVVVKDAWGSREFELEVGVYSVMPLDISSEYSRPVGKRINRLLPGGETVINLVYTPLPE